MHYSDQSTFHQQLQNDVKNLFHCAATCLGIADKWSFELATSQLQSCYDLFLCSNVNQHNNYRS